MLPDINELRLISSSKPSGSIDAQFLLFLMNRDVEAVFFLDWMQAAAASQNLIKGGEVERDEKKWFIVFYLFPHLKPLWNERMIKDALQKEKKPGI